MTISEIMDPLPDACPPTPPPAPLKSCVTYYSASQEHHCRRRRCHSDNMDDTQGSPILAPSPCAIAFQKELRFREGSTSTPFAQRSNGALTCSMDSGFSDVTSSFTLTCRIASPVTTTVSDVTNSVDDGIPFPRLSLEAIFAADEEEDDSAYTDDLFSSIPSSQRTSTDSGFGSSDVFCAICRTKSATSQLGSLHCDACAAVVTQYQPKCPDRLIGRRIGRETVDVISELARLDLSGPISKILHHISDADLCRSCCVSTQWQKACLSEPTANSRRLQYCRQLHSRGKENDCQSRLRRPGDDATSTMTKPNDPLANIQMLDVSSSMSPLLSTSALSSSKLQPTSCRAGQFWKVANTLCSDESLCVCPSCAHPARVHLVQERARCTNPQCWFDFCIACKCAFHGANDCVPSRRKKTRSDRAIVGSRLTRQNLRRL